MKRAWRVFLLLIVLGSYFWANPESGQSGTPDNTSPLKKMTEQYRHDLYFSPSALTWPNVLFLDPLPGVFLENKVDTITPPPAPHLKMAQIQSHPPRRTEAPSKRTSENATSFSGISLQKKNALFYMELRNADIKEVLRALCQENGINIIIGDGIEGVITLSFKDVTFDDAFKAILRMNNLTSYREGNIIRVMPSPFPVEEAGLVTHMMAINFANAKDMQETVKGLLSKNGTVMADSRTNTLVIRDLPGNLQKISEVVHRLDSKTPQVMIEARIVEVNTNFSRELGVQWGGQYTSRSGSTATTLHGGGFKNQATDTFFEAITGGTGVSGGPFAVNLPAQVGSGAGGAFGLSIGNVANTQLLDVQLSALEDAGKGKILSNPIIMTLNNKEAKISSGTEILIPTTSIVSTSVSSSSSDVSGGTSSTGVTTIDAKLELTVTPQVTPDDQILIHVHVDKKDVDFSRQVQNIPPLTTRTAETDLLIRDKETIVIGGIYTHAETSGEAGVPWLSKIPILGWLFKKETKIEVQNELMIFITPTIRRDHDTLETLPFKWKKELSQQDHQD